MGLSMNKIVGGFLIALLAAGAWLWLQHDAKSSARSQAMTITATDGMGRSVVIPARPQRVISLNTSNLELYYAAGGKVVGRTETDALPEALRGELEQVALVGTTPNPSMEKILALQPDLILATTMPFHQNLIPVLEKAGVPILLQALDRYQQVQDTLTFYGQLSGQPDKAAREQAAIQARYDAVMKKIEHKPHPKTLIIWGSPESFYMATSQSFAGDLARSLGAENIADEGAGSSGQLNYVPLSMEYVAKQNPERILLITHSADDKVSHKFQNELARHPAWSGLKAVKDHQVHRLPYHLFAVNPGTRVGEAMTVMAQALYPEENKP